MPGKEIGVALLLWRTFFFFVGNPDLRKTRRRRVARLLRNTIFTRNKNRRSFCCGCGAHFAVGGKKTGPCFRRRRFFLGASSP